MSTYLLTIVMEAEPSALLLTAGLLGGLVLVGLLGATTAILRRHG